MEHAQLRPPPHQGRREGPAGHSLYRMIRQARELVRQAQMALYRPIQPLNVFGRELVALANTNYVKNVYSS